MLGPKVPDSLGWRSSRPLTIVYIIMALVSSLGWRSTRPLMIVYIIMALVSSLAGGPQDR